MLYLHLTIGGSVLCNQHKQIVSSSFFAKQIFNQTFLHTTYKQKDKKRQQLETLFLHHFYLYSLAIRLINYNQQVAARII